MTEKEVLSRRRKAEKELEPTFQELSEAMEAIIRDILKNVEDEHWDMESSFEAVKDKVNPLIAASNYRIELLLNDYIIEMLKIGKELAEEEPTLSHTELLLGFVLLRTVIKYFDKANKEILNETINAIYNIQSDLPYKTPYLNGLESRYNAIIVSEGTRSIAQAVIQAASSKKMLIVFYTIEDERVCPICAPLHGKIFSPMDAIGILPLHPNCRCYFILYVEI